MRENVVKMLWLMLRTTGYDDVAQLVDAAATMELGEGDRGQADLLLVAGSLADRLAGEKKVSCATEGCDTPEVNPELVELSDENAVYAPTVLCENCRRRNIRLIREKVQ